MEDSGLFFQNPPELGNPYDQDALLRSFVRRTFPEPLRGSLEADYRRLGNRAVTDILRWAADAEKHPPVHVPYDAWGKRVDRIEVSEGWKQLDRISAEEGLVASGYERRHGALSRVDQFIRLYLFAPSSAIYSCPLAMTDGAARAIEVHGDEELKRGALRHLTSRDPAEFWTSGQWMTERTGGSDVSGTSTVARLEDGTYKLYGTKWFTSATTSQMAMTLARIGEGAPLSLFYVELRDAEGNLRAIRVNRLKDKLGTRALPTAELSLEGTPAKLVGSPGDGVKKISALFNITRIYNACCSVSGMRRALQLARDYSRKRQAFGKALCELPLHVETLAELEIECAAAFFLTFHLVHLLGKDEVGEATAEERALLRILTPVAKLHTAKQAVALASEVLECFGGAGYVEDTGIPVLLRDAQVLSIWEGTTNVLSLDMLRAIARENALEPLLTDIRARLDRIRSPECVSAVDRTRRALEKIAAFASKEPAQAESRALAFSLARTTCASLLLEHAEWSITQDRAQDPHGRALRLALRWCEKELAPLITAPTERLDDDRVIALED